MLNERKCWYKLNVVTIVLAVLSVVGRVILTHVDLSHEALIGKPIDLASALVATTLGAASLLGLIIILSRFFAPLFPLPWGTICIPSVASYELMGFVGPLIISAPFALQAYGGSGIYVVCAAMLAPPVTWGFIWGWNVDVLQRPFCTAIGGIAAAGLLIWLC